MHTDRFSFEIAKSVVHCHTRARRVEAGADTESLRAEHADAVARALAAETARDEMTQELDRHRHRSEELMQRLLAEQRATYVTHSCF